MRQDISRFRSADVDVIVTGPDSRAAFEQRLGDAPFEGVPDPSHRIASLYGQEVSLLKMGRMPAAVGVDREGRVRFLSYGKSMRDIPSTDEVLLALTGSAGPDGPQEGRG